MRLRFRGFARFVCFCRLERRRRVAAQNLQHIGQFRQMIQRVAASGLVHVPEEIQIEQILPGLAAQRPRFDLRQIQIAQSECAQSDRNSAPGTFLVAEHDRSFISF